MPVTIKVRVVAARGLPILDRNEISVDSYVEVSFGDVKFKTPVVKKRVNPVWETAFRFEVADDTELQDTPLRFEVNEPEGPSFGSLALDLSVLLIRSDNSFEGWFPLYDTLRGVQGQIFLVIRLEVAEELNPFRDSSVGVQFFSVSAPPQAHIRTVEHVIGFLDELQVVADPEYDWKDLIRSSRISNEARKAVLQTAAMQTRRQLGKKALLVGANAILGYRECVDLEGDVTDRICIRAFGTAVRLGGPGISPLVFPFPPVSPPSGGGGRGSHRPGRALRTATAATATEPFGVPSAAASGDMLLLRGSLGREGGGGGHAQLSHKSSAALSHVGHSGDEGEGSHLVATGGGSEMGKTGTRVSGGEGGEGPHGSPRSSGVEREKEKERGGARKGRDREEKETAHAGPALFEAAAVFGAPAEDSFHRLPSPQGAAPAPGGPPPPPTPRGSLIREFQGAADKRGSRTAGRGGTLSFQKDREGAGAEKEKISVPPRNTPSSPTGGAGGLPRTFSPVARPFPSAGTQAGQSPHPQPHPLFHAHTAPYVSSSDPFGGPSVTGIGGMAAAAVNAQREEVRQISQGQRQAVSMRNIDILTLDRLPLDFTWQLGGVIVARSVKVLSPRLSQDTRSSWWQELRDELRAHAVALRCDAIIGYSENASFKEETVVLSCMGTAVQLRQLHRAYLLAPMWISPNTNRGTFDPYSQSQAAAQAPTPPQYLGQQLQQRLDALNAQSVHAGAFREQTRSSPKSPRGALKGARTGPGGVDLSAPTLEDEEQAAEAPDSEPMTLAPRKPRPQRGPLQGTYGSKALQGRSPKSPGGGRGQQGKDRLDREREKDRDREREGVQGGEGGGGILTPGGSRKPMASKPRPRPRQIKKAQGDSAPPRVSEWSRSSDDGLEGREATDEDEGLKRQGTDGGGSVGTRGVTMGGKGEESRRERERERRGVRKGTRRTRAQGRTQTSGGRGGIGVFLTAAAAGPGAPSSCADVPQADISASRGCRMLHIPWGPLVTDEDGGRGSEAAGWRQNEGQNRQGAHGEGNEGSRCLICDSGRVPSVVMATCEAPEGMPIIGKGVLVEARVCRLKKKTTGEAHAIEISEALPFLELDLHRQLTYKLMLLGTNCAFGMKVEIAVGPGVLIGIATATALYSPALPPPRRLDIRPSRAPKLPRLPQMAHSTGVGGSAEADRGGGGLFGGPLGEEEALKALQRRNARQRDLWSLHKSLGFRLAASFDYPEEYLISLARAVAEPFSRPTALVPNRQQPLAKGGRGGGRSGVPESSNAPTGGDEVLRAVVVQLPSGIPSYTLGGYFEAGGGTLDGREREIEETPLGQQQNAPSSNPPQIRQQRQVLLQEAAHAAPPPETPGSRYYRGPSVPPSRRLSESLRDSAGVMDGLQPFGGIPPFGAVPPAGASAPVLVGGDVGGMHGLRGRLQGDDSSSSSSGSSGEVGGGGGRRRRGQRQPAFVFDVFDDVDRNLVVALSDPLVPEGMALCTVDCLPGGKFERAASCFGGSKAGRVPVGTPYIEKGFSPHVSSLPAPFIYAIRRIELSDEAVGSASQISSALASVCNQMYAGVLFRQFLRGVFPCSVSSLQWRLTVLKENTLELVLTGHALHTIEGGGPDRIPELWRRRLVQWNGRRVPHGDALLWAAATGQRLRRKGKRERTRGTRWGSMDSELSLAQRRRRPSFDGDGDADGSSCSSSSDDCGDEDGEEDEEEGDGEDESSQGTEGEDEGEEEGEGGEEDLEANRESRRAKNAEMKALLAGLPLSSSAPAFVGTPSSTGVFRGLGLGTQAEGDRGGESSEEEVESALVPEDFIRECRKRQKEAGPDSMEEAARMNPHELLSTSQSRGRDETEYVKREAEEGEAEGEGHRGRMRPGEGDEGMERERERGAVGGRDRDREETLEGLEAQHLSGDSKDQIVL
eukprot:Cvel_10164.t1-p1 / transcript=Cvel_10164.t1 / gene=Cvel_10164 / organism=Chromera_velia_CCMP2878 / gene_product=C2 domain-containing protein 5, putative / transcript_product=C2 domain-containing protein 5, putative / location=Cvel_scaffold606:57735-77706(+) / protein_length=1913 / sequence_SO=supercontig / SO=protein_coding / is_pseudo=false